MQNLKAEMRRFGVKNKDIEELLGCSEKTVRNKLSGSTEFTLSEALKIRDALFPEMRLEYLFTSISQEESKAM